MRVLALDFDGVVSDSAPESFVVALRTYAQLRRESGRRESGLRDAGWRRPALSADSPLGCALAAVAEPLGPTVEAIRALPVYRRFLEIMPLGNRAEDYAVVLGAIEADADPADQAAYDALRARESPDFLRAFHARFYERRAAWSKADPDGWRTTLAPYAAFRDLLRRRAADVRLALATAKDRRSVDLLLATYGIGDLFEDGLVLDKEMGVSKRAHLEELRGRVGCGFGDITFVDDKVNHLDDVSPLGIRCALAAWGYNGERERVLARQRGYCVCTLDTAEVSLFPPL